MKRPIAALPLLALSCSLVVACPGWRRDSDDSTDAADESPETPEDPELHGTSETGGSSPPSSAPERSSGSDSGSGNAEQTCEEKLAALYAALDACEAGK